MFASTKGFGGQIQVRNICLKVSTSGMHLRGITEPAGYMNCISLTHFIKSCISLLPIHTFYLYFCYTSRFCFINCIRRMFTLLTGFTSLRFTATMAPIAASRSILPINKHAWRPITFVVHRCWKYSPLYTEIPFANNCFLEKHRHNNPCT